MKTHLVQWFGEYVSDLLVGSHKLQNDSSFLDMIPNERAGFFYVLYSFVKNWVFSHPNGTLSIPFKYRKMWIMASK